MYSQKALSRIEIIKKKIEFIQNIVHEKGSAIIVGLVPPNAKTRSNRKGYLLMSRIRILLRCLAVPNLLVIFSNRISQIGLTLHEGFMEY